VKRPEARGSSPGEVPLILIVDDNEDARDMYALYFEHVGLRVATARDGEDALRKVDTLKPSLIVMDLTMPGMDGWTATRLLKAAPETRDIPVIALTGQVMQGADTQAHAAGCDRYVMKPCLPDDLLTIVRDMIADRRERRRPRP
jgi:two-component system cell cycle response regulator DivK